MGGVEKGTDGDENENENWAHRKGDGVLYDIL